MATKHSKLTTKQVLQVLKAKASHADARVIASECTRINRENALRERLAFQGAHAVLSKRLPGMPPTTVRRLAADVLRNVRFMEGVKQ